MIAVRTLIPPATQAAFMIGIPTSRHKAVIRPAWLDREIPLSRIVKYQVLPFLFGGDFVSIETGSSAWSSVSAVTGSLGVKSDKVMCFNFRNSFASRRYYVTSLSKNERMEHVGYGSLHIPPLSINTSDTSITIHCRRRSNIDLVIQADFRINHVSVGRKERSPGKEGRKH